MLISPKISANPYDKDEFLDMMEKMNHLSGEKKTREYFLLLKEEVENLPNNNILDRVNTRLLNTKMRKLRHASPHAEIFYNSIYLEFIKAFKNQPIKDAINFLECLFCH